MYHLLGMLCLVYGAFVLSLCLIRNSLEGRLCFIFCGGVIFGVGMLLYGLYVKNSGRVVRTVASGEFSASDQLQPH